ncbi:hypothetical protein GQ44DRAFT_769201 [Phaeosphaeriaceae sp. PMI808]|nr:hypothetical protein GQ44DRAFT_769201 [Phaeosphaeriaceae sp. PMI808]
MPNDIAANRSALKDFLASTATISGDLSNITAPPFVLHDKSTVKIPQHRADRPSLFVSQAAETNAEKRALHVLNHHPHITACYLWNDKHGVRAEGFTQQEITFFGNVTIKQKGFALLHLDKYDEDYLIPVPNVKVKGILTGTPYPELQGEYSLISSSGYVSRIKFEGRSFLGSGRKNGFEAELLHKDQPDEMLYTAKGAWNGILEFHDARSGEKIEAFNANDLVSATIEVADLDEQDPWESRNAWRDVISVLRSGDMKGVASAKSRVEEGQRHMRDKEKTCGEQWQTVFFERVKHDPIFDKLSALDPGSFTVDPAGGIWKANREKVESAKSPYHGDLLPTNERAASVSKNVPEAQQGEGVAVPLLADDTSKLNGNTKEGPQDELNAADQRRSSSLEEKRGVQGVSVPASNEPTDAEVEAFHRAKHSAGLQ